MNSFTRAMHHAGGYRDLRPTHIHPQEIVSRWITALSQFDGVARIGDQGIAIKDAAPPGVRVKGNAG